MKYTLLTLMSLFASTTLFADKLDIQTLAASFKQRITNDQNAVITYTGKLYASQKQNQALWEYDTPVIKKIYYKEGELVIIEPELEQAIYAKLDKIPNILKLLKSAEKISENTLQTNFNGLKYTITTEGNSIKTIAYKDEMQNSVVITFEKEVVNAPISSERFSFIIPKDYDILRQ